MTRVSIIIPAYNAQLTIGQTLHALISQNTKVIYEVIVVDDGSTDQTASRVKSFSNVRYFYQDNQGPAAARNHGALKALGEILLFTDSDCEPHPDWVEVMVNAFEKTKATAVCGSYGIANPDQILARCIHGEIIFRHQHLMPDYPKSFGSYNVGMRKDVFDKLKGFNQAYRNASGEDNDLSYRLIQAGGSIYFERKALVNHHHTSQIAKYLKEQYRHGFWRAKMFLEHPALAGGDGYTFWKDLIEVPWGIFIISGFFLSACGIMLFKQVIYFLLLPLLVLEIYFGIRVMHTFFERIYLSFVMFFRVFARLFGLSTGFLLIFFKKNEKKY